jgi:acyl carrier protein
MSTIQALQEYFAGQSDKARDLGVDDSLLERGLLDSMALVKLIAFLEERFGVELSDEEFDPEHFETLQAIAELIERKRPG